MGPGMEVPSDLVMQRLLIADLERINDQLRRELASVHRFVAIFFGLQILGCLAIVTFKWLF